MKKLLPFLSVLFLIGCKGRQQQPVIHEGKGQASNAIEIGFVDSIYSGILHQQRKIWVYIPNSFSYSVFRGQQQYPVVYLLDGDAHFHSFTGIMEHLSEQNGNMVCPDMIVVGILNTNRTRDLTPTQDTAAYHQSGGGEAFSAFVEKELIPHIDSLYHPAPFRLLVGHSYGGLTVINTLLHHAAPFNAFVAIDPSLSWHNNVLLRQADTLLATTDFQQKLLFVGVANTMAADMTLKRVQQEKSPENRHIRSILNFISYLKRKPTGTLRWDYNYYEDEDHYSVPIRAEYDALHFIFRDYAFTAYTELFDSTISTDSALQLVNAHFSYVSQKLGFKMLPSEHFINAVGYMFLNDGLKDRARAFFQMNIDNYPQSSNAYDCMGDFCAVQKDSAKALEYYKKAVSFTDNGTTRKKMSRILRK